MARLDGSNTSVELAPGYRLTAPGLEGTAEVRPARTRGTRDGGDERATDALDTALESAGMNEVQSVVIEATRRPVPEDRQVRTSANEEGLVLEVPDLGPTVGQVVMAIDEDGTISWHYPEDQTGRLETSATRGVGDSKRFVIRATSPAPSTADPTTRSLVWSIGKKVLKVLVYPIADTVLQTAARFFARKWEERYRPYGIRWFTPDNYRNAEGPPIEEADWGTLAGDRALLFIHGTFSRSFSGFYGISRDVMTQLHQRYGGRVFAFDHFSLSHDPERNLVEFIDRMPAGIELELDLISHSRGGLVARALAGETALGSISNIRVDKSVFVATPNHGTALADAEHMMAFIDRYTSLLNLIPPGPHEVVTDMLEVVITAVKMIGNAALEGLPGLTAMDPDGAFLNHMNRGVGTASTYYGVAADYEPQGGLAAMVKDGVVDRVFEDAANDLVVPTLGVFEGSRDPAFPIPEVRLLQFAPAQGVDHSGFFSQPAFGTALLGWLS